MGLFAISYDFHRAKNYQPLYDEFERLGAHRALESLFLANLNTDDPVVVKNHLLQFLDNDDSLIVVKFDDAPVPHRCKKGTSDWIKANCP